MARSRGTGKAFYEPGSAPMNFLPCNDMKPLIDRRTSSCKEVNFHRGSFAKCTPYKHEQISPQSFTRNTYSPIATMTPFNNHPHSPLVRYDIRSASPTMSPHESRPLWCFLEDIPMPFAISDIPLNANVYQLKLMIKDNVKSLHHVDPFHLRLWQVGSLIPGTCAF